MSYLFTSESVSEGHPDKVADQISDALLDEFLAYDKNSKVACETLVTTGQVVLAGEVKSSAYVDVQDVARNVIEKLVIRKANTSLKRNHVACSLLSMNRVATLTVVSSAKILIIKERATRV